MAKLKWEKLNKLDKGFIDIREEKRDRASAWLEKVEKSLEEKKQKMEKVKK